MAAIPDTACLIRDSSAVPATAAAPYPVQTGCGLCREACIVEPKAIKIELLAGWLAATYLQEKGAADPFG